MSGDSNQDDEAEGEAEADGDEKRREPLGWCLVANVKRSPTNRVDGTIGSGFRLFAPGAKLWLDPGQWGDGYERVHVVGRHRKSHRYIKAIVNRAKLENYRARQYYHTTIHRLLRGTWQLGAADYTAASLNDTLDAHVEMLHASGLFAAVLADPEDIDARAVLADWLCDRNDPRGPVLNAACACARACGDGSPVVVVDPVKQAELDQVEQRLGRVWLGSIAQDLEIKGWSRGFVQAAHWHGAPLDVEKAQRLARATPLTELHIGFVGAPPPWGFSDSTTPRLTAEGLEALPVLRSIVVLGMISPETAEEIARANPPSLERIVAPGAIADDDVRRILRSHKKFVATETTSTSNGAP